MGSQSERFARFTTPLGPDALLLSRMVGHEELGRPFRYELELLSEDVDISADDVVSKPACLTMDIPDQGERYFNGLVSEFRFLGVEGRFGRYQAVLRPWLWFLGLHSDCRIFQEMDALAIIEQVFRDRGFTDFDSSGVSRSCRTREYCVQYRESEFNFVSRLMEEEGIYYFFTHEEDKHILMLADDYSAHDTQPGYAQVPYFPPDDHGRRERDHIDDWELLFNFQPSAAALDDYNFKTPGSDLFVRSEIKSHPAANAEVYDYPGKYTDVGEGDAYVRIRNEALQAQYERVRGGGNAMGLITGALFELSDYPRDDQNKEYLILSANYIIRSDEFESGRGGGGEPFQVDFVAMDSRLPFRPQRITPKAVVRGPHTATVVGGGPVHVDQYGRVKVQFHWDRVGGNDEHSSCWVRVGQISAGSRWGAMFKPFVGHEVIVHFLEGDPDRPIIVGSVYNNRNMPPEPLPGNDHTFIFRDVFHNEIRFEGDRKYISIYSPTYNSTINTTIGLYFSTEQVYHAEIGANFNQIVGGDKREVVKGKSIKVEGEDAAKFTHGTDCAAFFGTKVEAFGGTKFSLDASSAFELTLGAKHGYSFTKEYKQNAGDLSQQAEGSITLNSDTEATLAGGDKGKCGIVNADDKSLELTFGEAVKPTLGDSKALAVAAWTACGGGIAAGIAAINSTVAAGQKKQDAMEHGDSDIQYCEENKDLIHNEAQHLNSMVGNIVGAAGAATGAIAALHKTYDPPVIPSADKANITLNKDGVSIGGDPGGNANKRGEALGWIALGKCKQGSDGVEIVTKKKGMTIEAKDTLQISSKDKKISIATPKAAMKITAKKTLTIKSDQQIAMTGTISHKNLKVMK